MGPEVVLATVMRPEGATGVQTHVRTTDAFLRAAGRPAAVVTPFDSPSPLLYPIFGARLPLRRVSRAAGVWWYRRWHAHFLADALRRHLGAETGPAVIYAQCPVAADVALRVRSDSPVVMAVHFNISQATEWVEHGELRPHGALYRSILAFEQRILPRLDGLVYVSEFMRRQVEERIPAARAVPAAVVPNAVPAPPVRDRRSGSGDLITVGALQPRKNLGYLFEVLAEAARRGHRYSLTVVGDGPSRAGLERRAAELGVADQVAFVGHQRDPGALVAAHRLYCHTATMESFGIAPLEAMAEGVPVVAGRVGGIPEFLQPGRVGEFWPLDDAAAAADVLIGLMENPALATMGAHAAAQAAQFSPDVLGTRLLAFLDSCHPPGRTTRSDPDPAASPTPRSRPGSPR